MRREKINLFLFLISICFNAIIIELKTNTFDENINSVQNRGKSNFRFSVPTERERLCFIENKTNHKNGRKSYFAFDFLYI